MLHAVLLLIRGLHAGAGMLALVAGTVAAAAAKGGPLHRRAGTLFFHAMVVMAVLAIVLAAILPGQAINIFIGVFTLYLVCTACLTVRGRRAAKAEALLACAGVALCAPFAVIAVQTAFRWPLFFTSAIAFKGPVEVALYCFTAVLVMAAICDIAVVLRDGLAGRARLARHVWRMCLGLALAYGSGFTNGFARLLPGPYHVPPAFFLPQFGPVVLLVFWMVRVRLMGWSYRRPALRAA